MVSATIGKALIAFGLLIALAGVVLVPYLALVLVEFTSDLLAGDRPPAAPEPATSTT